MLARLTYATLLARAKQQDWAFEQAALVDRMQAQQMRPAFRRVFDRFKEWDVAIVGSSLRDFDKAHDIDVLFPASQDFRQLAKELGLKYLGKFPSPLTKGDVRRLSNTAIDGVNKPIQCISDSSVTTFDQWPHALMLRDGRTLNAGKHYQKLPLDDDAAA